MYISSESWEHNWGLLDYWVEREQFFEAGNCHILKFSYKDGAFKFIEVINPINDN